MDLREAVSVSILAMLIASDNYRWEIHSEDYHSLDHDTPHSEPFWARLLLEIYSQNETSNSLHNVCKQISP